MLPSRVRYGDELGNALNRRVPLGECGTPFLGCSAKDGETQALCFAGVESLVPTPSRANGDGSRQVGVADHGNCDVLDLGPSERAQHIVEQSRGPDPRLAEEMQTHVADARERCP